MNEVEGEGMNEGDVRDPQPNRKMLCSSRSRILTHVVSARALSFLTR